MASQLKIGFFNVITLKLTLKEKTMDVHEAAENGNVLNFQMFVVELADMNPPRNDDSKTPLHLAALNGYENICEIILNFDEVKEKNPKDNKGVTPLHLAAYNGHTEICKLFFHHVQEKNPADSKGSTPLHYAAGKGHLITCKLILDVLRESKNPPDHKGVTPLHFAAVKGHLETCTLILEKLCQNRNPKTLNGKTPGDFAHRNGHFELSKFLGKQANIQLVIINNPNPNQLLPFKIRSGGRVFKLQLPRNLLQPLETGRSRIADGPAGEFLKQVLLRNVPTALNLPQDSAERYFQSKINFAFNLKT